MTYKVLFNGYVSMTGGQPHDGDLTVARVIDIARAEGVGRIVVVADDPGRYRDAPPPDGIPVRPRTELDDVQRELREFEGVSVLVYDQACATEMRRQRKKDPALDIPKRSWIHPEVCEGCGDCGVKSNCMSVEPLETELGRKRRINQSTCNKDFSCVQGFCPSFVTIHGGRLRRRPRQSAEAGKPLPVPALPSVERGYNVVLAGIGGTGIVTVGAMLAQAAHLDGLRASVLDLTGMAQKYGAVMSHLRFMPADTILPSSRLASGEADTVIGCDLIVTSGQEALSKMAPGRTFAVVNSAIVPTGDFTRMPDWDPNAASLLARVQERTGGVVHAVDAEQLATALMGDSIATNMFLLGFAWQHGRIPVSLASLDKAIELSGVELAFNRSSFDWGRRMAVEPDAVLKAAEGPPAEANVVKFAPRKLHRLDDIVADRMRRLTAYQDAGYAARYLTLVERARAKDEELDAGGNLARVVARSYYKLLANKDEYEVARLFSAPEFKRQLQEQFDGDYTLHFHLGAWPLARRDPRTGEMRKRELGPWVLRAMGVLQRMRRLRGTVLDPFRNSPERKLAARLLAQYEADISDICDHARVATAATALASWPEKVRGYGGVRERHARDVAEERVALRAQILHAYAVAA